MIHGIVNSHGGRLEIDSGPLGGTHIRLWLPCLGPDASAPPPPMDAAGEDRSLLDNALDYAGVVAHAPGGARAAGIR
jgi:hypothetical protein